MVVQLLFFVSLSVCDWLGENKSDIGIL